MRREQAQADDQTFFERFEIIFVQAGVYDEDKDGRDLCWSAKRVFDGCKLWQKFGWQVGCRNVFVVRWESIALQTEGTNPKLASHVNLTVGL